MKYIPFGASEVVVSCKSFGDGDRVDAGLTARGIPGMVCS